MISSPASKTLLKPNGRIVLEFPYGVDFIEHTEFDTIYHEHVFYFTLTALQPLFARHGLEIFRVERLPIHGGSLRCSPATRARTAVEAPSRNCWPRKNERASLRSPITKVSPTRCSKSKANSSNCSRKLKKEGKRIAAYGASAKGSTLLNYYGVGAPNARFRRRPQHLQTGPAHARHAYPDSAAGRIAQTPAGLHAVADLEFCR